MVFLVKNMKGFKNNNHPFTIDICALKPLSLKYTIVNINQFNGYRKIKFKDLKREKINAGCNLKIICLRNGLTRYIRALSLEYMITKVCLFRACARYIAPISYYRKRDVNDS